MSGAERLGATPLAEGVQFAVWAPHAETVNVVLEGSNDTLSRTFALVAQDDGVFSAMVAQGRVGSLYRFEVDGVLLPDPYARFLPRGVHGVARVEPRVRVSPLAGGLKREGLVPYELHLGTFTPHGNLRAALEKLTHVKELGATAVELMPLSSFAGERGWGYDGVAHFAPHSAYGSPEDLRAFVDEAHRLGLGVIVDVVYNHFGPAGNYLPAFAPEYFTANHQTAWGDAPDYSHPRMRTYVLDNVAYWLDEMGCDGLRLDATHGIVDHSPEHILRAITSYAHALTPPRLVFAEDERNDAALVTEMNLDGLWADDFHHAVRVALTGERDGYYAAYRPDVEEIARAIRQGWLYRGEIYPPTNKPRGTNADALDAASFLYCIQNHDQIGNRAFGHRVHHDASVESYLAASMLLLFLPMTPLLFMGQEWAATAPFLYFTDHEPELGAKISEGRRSEFGGFASFRDPEARARIPDPQTRETFAASKLDWTELSKPPHARIFDLYRRMLRLRREDDVLRRGDRDLSIEVIGRGLRIERRANGERRILLVSFDSEPATMPDLDRPLLVESGPDARVTGGRLAPFAAVVVC